MRSTILLGRIFFSLIFLTSGLSHFTSATIDYGASAGVPFPGFLVPASGALAVLGALSILFGYKAKLGAWAIIFFLVPVTLKMHAFWMISDPEAAALQQVMFFKNLSMLGGALSFAYFGAGALSIDARERTDSRTLSGGRVPMGEGAILPTALRQADVDADLLKKNL